MPKTMKRPRGAESLATVMMPYRCRREAFTVANGASDLNIREAVDGPFNGMTYFYHLKITTDQTITVRFNFDDEPTVEITAAMSPYTLEWVAVDNLFISNASGSTANIVTDGQGV